MKRPLTTRRWFRVGLVCVLLVGGYGTAYLMVREWSQSTQAVVNIEYPQGDRMFAVSEDGRVFVGVYAMIYEDLDGLQSSYVTSVDDVPVDPAGEPSEQLAELYYTGGDGDWRATACRVFYLAERIELLLRGFAVADGESIVIGE